MHKSLGADKMLGDAANLCTDSLEYEHFPAVYRIQQRMQCGDNDTIVLMLERNQVVRASMHTSLTKKYYKFKKHATHVYQDLQPACNRHW